jgi:transposase-like protein
VPLRGEPYLLWRAVDEHGAELDVLVQKRRDRAAAKRFFHAASFDEVPQVSAVSTRGAALAETAYLLGPLS